MVIIMVVIMLATTVVIMLHTRLRLFLPMQVSEFGFNEYYAVQLFIRRNFEKKIVNSRVEL